MKRLLRSLPIAALVLVGAGCGGPAASTNPLTGTTAFQDDEGNKVEVGAGARIPADFPADVPAYPGATVISSATMSDGDSRGASLMLSTADAADKVAGWYEERLGAGGWAKTGGYTMAGSDSRVYGKGGADLTVTASGEAGGETSVIVVWTPNE